MCVLVPECSPTCCRSGRVQTWHPCHVGCCGAWTLSLVTLCSSCLEQLLGHTQCLSPARSVGQMSEFRATHTPGARQFLVCYGGPSPIQLYFRWQSLLLTLSGGCSGFQFLSSFMNMGLSMVGSCQQWKNLSENCLVNASVATRHRNKTGN